MIVIAEINYRGNVHEMVNSCMIDIMHNLFPEEEVCLMGERSHLDNLLKLCETKNIRTIELPQGGTLSRVLAIWQVLRLAAKYRARYVLLLSALPLGGTLLRLMKWMFPWRRVLAVSHGELEHLRRKKGEPDYRLGRLQKFALHARCRIRYIVLSESIRRNLLEQLPSLRNRRIIAIDHPYRYPDIPPHEPHDSVDFVQFGVGSFYKGSNHLFQSAWLIHEKVSPATRFYIAGGIYPEMAPYLDDGVIYPQPGTNLTREQIDGIAARCDYALFYYTNDHYKLCASGAFFDAVRYGMPILCLQNDFFASYFEKYGDLGYLFRDTDELNAKLADLIRDFPSEREHYMRQAANVSGLRQALSVENITRQLEGQL